MSDELVIITPELERGSGGVADYTLHLIDAWRGSSEFRFILPEGAVVSSEHESEIVAREANALRKKLPLHGGKILVQYSAYGFDRRGYPRWLLHPLIEWRKQSGGLLAIMFHEIWTLLPVVNKHYLVQHLHRHTIGQLIRVADAVFTSTTGQAAELRKLDADCAVQVLPVGSNIPAPKHSDATRDPHLAILFGRESRRLIDLQLLRDDLKALAAAGVIRKVITGGAISTSEEADLLRALPLTSGFEQRGQLAPNEVSNLLAGARFGLSSQDPLSLQKSGTFMAYASHGASVISPHADSFGAEPLSWLVHPRELLEGIDAGELQSRAESLRAWQERTASWPEIARRIGDALHLNL